MRKMGRAVMLAAFLALPLGGCEAASGLGGMIFSSMSSAGVGALQEKVRARAEHTSEAKMYFRDMASVLKKKAESLADQGKYDKAMRVYDYIFERHESLKPQFMLTKGIGLLRTRRLERQQHELELERIRAGTEVIPMPVVPVEVTPLLPEREPPP